MENILLTSYIILRNLERLVDWIDGDICKMKLLDPGETPYIHHPATCVLVITVALATITYVLIFPCFICGSF